MEIVPTTFLALAVAALLLRVGVQRGLWAFFLLAPLGASAALNFPAVGGVTLGMLEFTVCAIILSLMLQPEGPNRFFGSLRPGQPGFWLLMLVVYSIVSSLFFPRVFSGQTEIFSLSRALNSTGIVTVPLQPSSGNVSQPVLFLLAALCFVAMATVFRRHPDASTVLLAMMVVTTANFVLGWLDVISFVLGLEFLLDPIRNANYAILSNVTLAGIKRMVGGMTEASSFGMFSFGLMAFWLHYAITGPRKRSTTAMLVMAAIAVFASTSSATYVAVAVFLGLYSVGWALLAGRGRVSPRAAKLIFATVIFLWLGSAAMLASYHILPGVQDFVDATLLDKLDSDSGVERGSWNSQALANFQQTWFLGAGLGSVRASSWLVACLGSIGVIGTALFLGFLATVATTRADTQDAARDATIQSLKIACLALLVVAMLVATTPNLGMFFFALAGLSAGLARGGQSQRAQAVPPWLAPLPRALAEL